jgi:serine/threonine protein kinase
LAATQVREAIHRLTRAKVAIKTLRKKQYLAARMRYPPREVEVLAALDHPHINRLYDKVELEDRVHLILEHVQGRELCDIV